MGPRTAEPNPETTVLYRTQTSSSCKKTEEEKTKKELALLRQQHDRLILEYRQLARQQQIQQEREQHTELLQEQIIRELTQANRSSSHRSRGLNNSSYSSNLQADRQSALQRVAVSTDQTTSNNAADNRTTSKSVSTTNNKQPDYNQGDTRPCCLFKSCPWCTADNTGKVSNQTTGDLVTPNKPLYSSTSDCQQPLTDCEYSEDEVFEMSNLFTPSAFHGLTTEDVKQWLKDFESWAKFKKMRNDEMMGAVCCLLKDQALVFFDKLDERVANDFCRFKETFSERYTQKTNEWKMASDVYNYKQDPNVAFEHYFAEVYRRASRLNMPDEQLKLALMMNMKPQLRQAIIAAGKSSAPTEDIVRFCTEANQPEAQPTGDLSALYKAMKEMEKKIGRMPIEVAEKLATAESTHIQVVQQQPVQPVEQQIQPVQQQVQHQQ